MLFVNTEESTVFVKIFDFQFLKDLLIFETDWAGILILFLNVCPFLCERDKNFETSINKKKYLVWHSHNFLLPYITIEDFIYFFF